MPWIVEEVVGEIVDGIRIIVVVVVPLADEQPRGLSQLGMQCVAGVGMSDLHAGAGQAGAKEPPRLEDVRLDEAPFVVGVGRGIVAAAAAAGCPARTDRHVLGHEIPEHRCGIGDLRLIAEGIRQVPRTRNAHAAGRRHDLHFSVVVHHGLDLPSVEPDAARERPGQRRRVAARRLRQNYRKRLQLRLTIDRGPHLPCTLYRRTPLALFFRHAYTPRKTHISIATRTASNDKPARCEQPDDSFPRGFAPRTPLHALSRAASPARSVRVAHSLPLVRAVYETACSVPDTSSA